MALQRRRVKTDWSGCCLGALLGESSLWNFDKVHLFSIYSWTLISFFLRDLLNSSILIYYFFILFIPMFLCLTFLFYFFSVSFYTHRHEHTNIHARGGIRTCNPSDQASGFRSCLYSLSHPDWQFSYQIDTHLPSRGCMDTVPDPILRETFLGYSWKSNPGPLGWQSDVLTTTPKRRSFSLKSVVENKNNTGSPLYS